MNIDAMFSSKTDLWATPQDFYEKLNADFGFTLDPCATPENAKCAKFYTKEQDGLRQNWGGEIVFCNPPYGREIYDWVRKCYEEAQKPKTTVVMLIPARTDTCYFHKYIYRKAREIRFLKGRLKFGNQANSAPFPSMIVVF
ncbi:DNA N-6-adenine-methyltransferase [Alistipes finegoldii]|jgi:site-specific DNA-methyltransferase (adenine-specific)|uniref:DNA N-6-adenine-methyltransferase n=1 Tax=Alistipes finegoldii TaxID=214856 RepID=UPI00242BDDBC|nr:DNA N-6-adenine-methyltransferase [Alistipes finegoldii]